jgi:large subunit ribosomal protein L23
MHSYEVLRRPVITEKNTLLIEQNKYAFEVAREANKTQIRDAVEKAFKVKVTAVNVIHVPGKMRRAGRRRGMTSHVPGKMRRAGRRRGMTSSWKKAVVTLEPGQKIELFEGV